MDQFGLGADTLLELNPGVVVVRMPAFGLTGPWRDRVGFAPTMEQIAGLAWVTGLPDGSAGRPARCLRSTRGRTCGVRALAALEFADRTGRGQLVEVPMIETVLNVTAVQTMEFEVFGTVMERRGNRGHTRRDAGYLPVRGRGQLDRGERTHRRRALRLGRTHRRPGRRHRGVAGRAGRRGGRGKACGGRDSGGRGDIAVTGDREPATGAPRLLRAARASADRRGPVPVSAVRPARRRREVAASHAADAGAAQQRGADGAVWAHRRRSGPAGRRTASSAPGRRVCEQRGVSAASARSASRRRSTCCW